MSSNQKTIVLKLWTQMIVLALVFPTRSQGEPRPISPTQQTQLTDLAQTTNQIAKQSTAYEGEFRTHPEQAQTLVNTGNIDQSLEDIEAANRSLQCATCSASLKPSPPLDDQQACEKLRGGDPFRVFFSARYSDIHSPDKNLSKRKFESCSGLVADAKALCERNLTDRDRLLKVNTEAELRQTMQQISQGRSFEEITDFVSRVGGDMSTVYDMDRNKDSVLAKGGVSCLGLIDAMRTQGKAGVCRDMALCQTQLLHYAGVKNAYTIAFATPANYHTTVLAENPNSPGDTRVINYNEVLSGNGTNDALVRSQPHSISAQGIVIRAYGANGKPVTTLPTLVGQFLNEATGGSGRDFNPFLDDRSQIASSQIQIGDDPCSRFSVSVGRLQDGTRAVTLAYIRDVETENSLHRFAIALGGRENDLAYEKLTSADVYAKYEYTRKLLKAEFESGKIDLYFKTRIEAMLSQLQGQLNNRSNLENLQLQMKTLDLIQKISAHPQQTISQVRSTLGQQRVAQSGITGDGNVAVEIGVRGKNRITSSTELEYYLRVQAQPAAVQVNTLGADNRRYRGFVNLIDSGVAVRQELTKGIFLELLLQAAIQEPTSVLGYKASVGSESVRAYYRGTQPTPGQAPSVLSPGSFRTHALGLEWRNQATNAYWWIEMSEQRFGEGNKQKEQRIDTGFTSQIDWGHD